MSRLKLIPKKKKVKQPRSFRKLKAFGLWAERSEVTDSARWTLENRSKMEHGRDRD